MNGNETAAPARQSVAAREQAETYCNVVFGDRRGHLRFAFGVGGHFKEGRYVFEHWHDRHGLWPNDRERFLDEALRRTETDDVYVCPYLGSTPKRSQGSAVSSAVLYADLDGEDPRGRLDAYPQSAALVVVDSGRGLHVYARLAEALESAELMAGNRRLRDALGGDSKVSDNDVLRLPGTTNHKVGASVELVSAGHVVALGELHLPEARGVPQTVGGAELKPASFVNPFKLPGLVRFLLREEPGTDRSAQTYGFVKACLDHGLEPPLIAALTLEHKPTRSRGRRRAEVLQDVARIIAKEAS